LDVIYKKIAGNISLISTWPASPGDKFILVPKFWNFENGKWRPFENEPSPPWFKEDTWESTGLKAKEDLKCSTVEIEEGMISKSILEES
jgi:hypothetical protein